MNRQSATRRPLAELHNGQSTTHSSVSQVGIKRADRVQGITRDNTLISKRLSTITKPPSSSIPSAPARRKTQVPRSLSPDDGIGLPPRQNAKPKRHVQSNEACLSTSDDRRRTGASMNFTSSRTAARGGVSATRHDFSTQKLDQIADTQARIWQEMEKLQQIQPRVAMSEPPMGSDKMREQVEQMREQLDQLTKAQSESSAKEEFSDRVLKLFEENAQLKVSIHAEQTNHSTTQRQIESLKEELERSSLENERLTMRIEDLQQKVVNIESGSGSKEVEMEQLRMEAENLRAELKATKVGRQSDQDSLRKMQQVAADLSEQLATRDATLAQLEKELNVMSIKMKDTSREIHEAKAEILTRSTGLQRAERELDAVRTERDDLLCELQAKSTSLRQAKNEVREAHSTIDCLTKEKEAVRREADSKLWSVREDAESQLHALKKEKDASRAHSDHLAREVAECRAQIESLKEAVTQYEAKTSRMNADKATMTVQFEILREDKEGLLEQNRSLLNTIEHQTVELNELQAQAREDAKRRRKLHNMIQELKGNIRVFCRVRPVLAKEVINGSADLFEYTERGQGVVAKAPAREDGKAGSNYAFKFDKVFDPSCTQSTVFEEISELVQSALDGYRVCIFAYGQTGSGKTYTMLGQSEDGSEKELGMIPRAVRQVFDSAKAMERDDWSFKLRASFLEIYNEAVRDLLGDGVKAGNNKAGDHKITFNADTKLCTVSDMTVADVTNEEQVQRLIERSMRNRATAATKVNERSSRSHSVFRLQIVGHNASTGQELDGLLNLIDLAGSERLTQSKAEGERLRETRHINKSLSALGDVIAALANREKHVPFRNSKLTHLLQDSLGGDCKTLMFVNVSHASESFGESLCSLRFAAKVNSCHVGTARRTARIDLQ